MILHLFAIYIYTAHVLMWVMSCVNVRCISATHWNQWPSHRPTRIAFFYSSLTLALYSNKNASIFVAFGVPLTVNKNTTHVLHVSYTLQKSHAFRHVHESLKKCKFCLREVLLHLNRLSLMAAEPIICSGDREGQLLPETSGMDWPSGLPGVSRRADGSVGRFGLSPALYNNVIPM